MAIIRVQVTLAHDSALPEDSVVNTFHLSGSNVQSDLIQTTTPIDAFYTAISAYLSQSLAGTGTIKTYDEADPEPRVPKSGPELITFTTAGTSLPEECALCLSYQANPVSGLPQARRRGRMFLGPLSSAAAAIDSATRMRVPAAARTTITTAFETFYDSLNTVGYTFGVYSPTSDLFVGVNTCWMDDALDTIRSRGPVPTARTTRTVNP